jgi:hypothetical protein
MSQVSNKEPSGDSIEVKWGNRDHPLFEDLTNTTRDAIDKRISSNFIGERGGKGFNQNDRLHLEFIKMPSSKELEEWEMHSRHKEVKIKAFVEISAQIIRVNSVEDIVIQDGMLLIKGSEQQKRNSTLFCFPKSDGIAYELYDVSPSERVDAGQLQFTFKLDIDRMKETGHGILSEDEAKPEAIFRVDPIKSGEVDSMVFEESVLIYTKTSGGVLLIDAFPSETQRANYS